MGINIHDPLVQIKVTESVCGFVAVCVTLLRLYLRRSRYWWDDFWAFFSLLCLIIQVASVFMHVEHPTDLSRLNRIASYYLMAMTFYAVIWTARLSILFSIIRIDPDPVWRSRLRWLGALFIAALCFFYAQLLWTCETMTNGWKNKVSPQCPLPKQVAICQLVSDVIADLFLILLPIRLIRGIRDKGLRWRLYFIFSTSIVTTVVSLVHAAYIITTGGIPVVISALVEDCMSLTVANLPVVATASLRRLTGASTRDANPDNDGQRWSSFKFRTRTQQPGATTHLTTGFGAISRGTGGRIPIGTEVSGISTFEPTKSTIPVVAEDVFAAKVEMDGDAEKGQSFDPQVRRGDGVGVVRIGTLPYPREPPPPKS